MNQRMQNQPENSQDQNSDQSAPMPFSSKEYPELSDMQEGDQVQIMITGTIGKSNGDMVDIQPSKVDVQSNQAEQEKNKMMSQPNMNSGNDTEDANSGDSQGTYY